MEMDERRVRELMDFFHEVGKLKEVKRQGWVVSGVSDGESSAEHSFRFAIMAMVLGQDAGVDVCKAIKMGLVHDLAESRIGDIITWKGFHMGDEEKLKKERTAMESMTQPLGEVGKEIMRLWEEFEARKTPEAKFAKEIDKLEMVFQAFEYERTRKGLNSGIHSFYDWADDHSAGAVKSPELRRLVERLMEQRRELGFDRSDRYPDRAPSADK